MNKLFFIPRAIAAVLSLWVKPLSVEEKLLLTATFSSLKLKKWWQKENTIIDFPLLHFKCKGYNNESLQYLVKEIFIDKVYDAKKVWGEKESLNIIDAGSNIGLSVLYFKSCWKQAYIHAIEPNETAVALLKENIDRNHIEKVQVIHAALSNSDGRVYAHDGFNPASVNQQFSLEPNGGKPIPAVRLTTLLQSRQYDGVKLDIEGAEKEVLADVINNNCLNKVHCWWIEFHQTEEQINAIVKKFVHHGFEYSRNKEVYCFIQTHKKV